MDITSKENKNKQLAEIRSHLISLRNTLKHDIKFSTDSGNYVSHDDDIIMLRRVDTMLHILEI
jgi:hypothetical protein